MTCVHDPERESHPHRWVGWLRSRDGARMALYDGAAAWYDRIWGPRRDHEKDVSTLVELIDGRCPDARSLLDVGCATGEHLRLLRSRYHCTGIDLSRKLLEVANDKLGTDVGLLQADMRTLDLRRRFDVVTCLWGTVAYAVTERHLGELAGRIAAHLEPGGVAVVEPWLTPEAFDDPGMVSVIVDDETQPVVTVIGATSRVDDVAHLRRLYVSASPGRLDTVEEHHELGLFTEGQYRSAFRQAGLAVEWLTPGLAGRGLLVGVRTS